MPTHNRKRPNVIVLMADDHRGTELSHLPHSQASTPVLDALANRGVSFTQAHCQGGMTGAVCVPSRASLMTGRNIFASSEDPTGGNPKLRDVIPPDLETFPEALRWAGYHTHAIGKWHNDRESFRRSFSSGEAVAFIGMSDHHAVPIRAYQPEKTGADEAFLGEIEHVEGFSSDIFTEAAIDFLNRDHESNPFLLYVAFTAPHDPRTPPPGWVVDPASIELPPNFLPQHPFDNGDMDVRDELLAGFPRTPAEVRQHIADYYGMIAHLDYSVGRILDAIDARRLTEDTIVIYTGDHGLAVGQHGLMGKQNLYEHSSRIPLVIAGPGVPSGERCADLVWHGDTTATIRALCGVEANPAGEGRTLIDQNRLVGMSRSLFGAAYEFGQRMFRDERYKLIRYSPIPANAPDLGFTQGTKMTQLFDLEQDSWEMHNLAEDPAYQEIVERLTAGFHAWQSEVGDPLLAFR